jgi:hypothetical protein
MAFHTANYDVYAVLGNPNTPPLWMWAVWRRFLPAIDPLIQVARGKPGVRSTQYLPNRAGVVKFGKLGWKEADHQKWSHGSPTNEKESQSWGFLSLQVWAPAWTVCEREIQSPDVFMSITNESLGSGFRQDLLFNPVVLLAVVSELARQEVSIVRTAVSSLWTLLEPKLVGHRQRPWGVAFGATGFTDAIQDLSASGLFKPGQRHKREVGFHLFAEEWQPVLTGGAALEPGSVPDLGGTSS